jgi:lysophospholipase L1-like esterase
MTRALAWSVALNVLFACAAAAWLIRRIAAQRAPSRPSLQMLRSEQFHELARRPVRGEVVMLGDSLTQYGEWSELLGRPVANRGIAGDTVADVRARLSDVVALRPATVFLLVGINDLERGTSPSEVVEQQAMLIRELRRALPSARLVVQSLLPVRGRSASLAGAIAQTNASLPRAVQAEGVTWLDVAGKMADASGELADRFSGDGLHLSGAGYGAWADVVRPLLP